MSNGVNLLTLVVKTYLHSLLMSYMKKIDFPHFEPLLGTLMRMVSGLYTQIFSLPGIFSISNPILPGLYVIRLLRDLDTTGYY